MTLSSYAKGKGLTFPEYEKLSAEVCNSANKILEKGKRLHPTDTGMYYSTEELFNSENDEILPYIIKELKTKGMEFMENNAIWRV